MGVSTVKNRKIIVITGAILLACIVLMGIFGNPLMLKNRYGFGQSIKSIRAETVTLGEITPFDWDAVYTFAPYTAKQEMENVIGFKSKYITETVNEGMVQLFFVKGNKVVCDIVGYSSNLGYSISIWVGNGESYCKIERDEDVVFLVERGGDIPILLRKE